MSLKAIFLKMDPRPEDILTVDLNVDIDPTILLCLEFETMKFVSELDVESVLSEGDSKIIETNYTPKDFENQYSQTSDTYSDSDNEEPTSGTESETNKDINGNEETLSDYNLNRLFCELDLSDSDNEEKEDEEPSPKLRERGKSDRTSSSRNQNRTNPLKSSDKYNRSQIDPRNLQFLSGSSFVESSSASHYFPLENNHLPTFDSNEVFYNVTNNEPISTSYPQFYEDSRANSIGSPESGYESSLTGSPPPVLSTTFINHRLELISQLDDVGFINYVIEDPAVCALTDHAAPKQLIDNREKVDKEKRINELVEFLKNTSSELVEVASPDRNAETVPLVQNFEDTNNFEIVLPPMLKNVRMPKLGYKVKDEAKRELRRLLSQDKFWATEEKIFKRLIEDKKENRPIRVIYVDDEKDKLGENRTNLHYAVLKQNIEEIYCLVEIQKTYDLTFSDLNIRDKYEKTALDYAIKQHMHHAVIDYLKENHACQNVIVERKSLKIVK